MKWSWKLGTLAGIPVYVHATFTLLLGWVGLVNWLSGRTLSAAVEGIVFVAAIFGCVVLHELGHALAARRYGILTRDITLLPIGGVARLERMPDKPMQEFWVALAGPAVNVVIAAGLFLWLKVTSGFEPLSALSVAEGSFIERLMVVNVFLVAFNMIPAFPMDGGRVLRSLLATRLQYARATQIAAMFGQGFAFIFGFVGLFTNPFLIFIAFFVWIGAAQELGAAQMRSVLGNVRVSESMQTDFDTLDPGDPLSRAIERTLSGSQKDFPVVSEGRVVGILTQDRLMRSLVSGGDAMMVGSAMTEDFDVIEAHELLETVMLRVRAGGTPLPVFDGGRLVGLLTMENVGEFVGFRSALRSADSSGIDRGPAGASAHNSETPVFNSSRSG
jgi:Zn-dependent protease/CBS domain-containing protein